MKAPIRASLALAVAILIVAAAFPSVTTAWGGKPWDSRHESIECELEINPLGGSVYGQIECPEEKKTWWNSYHPAMSSDMFDASAIGTTDIQFSLRPSLARFGDKHGAMSCFGTWERSAWVSFATNNDFGVRCISSGHADIACTDWMGRSSSNDLTDSITVRCKPMESFTGKKWIYWDLNHDYDASVMVEVLKTGVVRATPNDPQPTPVEIVRFEIQNRNTRKVRTQDVAVMGERADLVLSKPGRYFVTAYFCSLSDCESVLYVSERMTVTR